MAVAAHDGKPGDGRVAEREVRAVFNRSSAKLANLVSFARLLTVIPLVWLICVEEYTYAFWLLIGAGVTDAVDGFIAKWFDGRSDLGALLDPIADKALLNGIYVALAVVAGLPGWLATMVVGRDLLIVLGAVLIRRRNSAYQPRPLLIGKVNTFAQIVLAVAALAHLAGFFDFTEQISALLAGVALTTALSGLGYAIQGLKALNAAPQPLVAEEPHA